MISETPGEGACSGLVEHFLNVRHVRRESGDGVLETELNYSHGQFVLGDVEGLNVKLTAER